jgi:hypothetical protein
MRKAPAWKMNLTSCVTKICDEAIKTVLSESATLLGAEKCSGRSHPTGRKVGMFVYLCHVLSVKTSFAADIWFCSLTAVPYYIFVLDILDQSTWKKYLRLMDCLLRRYYLAVNKVTICV